jgi:hypothetical protein
MSPFGQTASEYSGLFPINFGVKFLSEYPNEYIYLSIGRTVEVSTSVTIDSYWEVVCKFSNGTKMDGLARSLP